jgi:hypothetical protein
MLKQGAKARLSRFSRVFTVSENPIRHPAKFRIQAHGGFPVNVYP